MSGKLREVLSRLQEIQRGITPTPWRPGGFEGDKYVIGPDGSALWSSEGKVYNQADVPLIAAAPDMRDALVEARELLEAAEQAMDQAWAAVGDRLLARGPLSKEYAHAATGRLDEALRRIREALGR